MVSLFCAFNTFSCKLDQNPITLTHVLISSPPPHPPPVTSVVRDLHDGAKNDAWSASNRLSLHFSLFMRGTAHTFSSNPQPETHFIRYLVVVHLLEGFMASIHQPDARVWVEIVISSHSHHKIYPYESCVNRRGQILFFSIFLFYFFNACDLFFVFYRQYIFFLSTFFLVALL